MSNALTDEEVYAKFDSNTAAFSKALSPAL
jgi:hypothetical protein